jgi:A nuclease of the HNH/ENDO VII superfamily with conserved WHH
MSGYLAREGVNIDQRRSAWETLSSMNSAYRELAIDAGLAVGGAVPMVGWAADAVALGRSWTSGTWTDVIFDLAGFVPALGDTAKGGRILAKIDDLRRTLDIANTAVGRMFQGTREAATKYWADIAKAREEAYQAAVARCSGRQPCIDALPSRKGPQYNNAPSTGGRWDGERGDGVWHPDGGGAPIKYTNGFPDFSGHVVTSGGVPGRVEIPMTGTSSDRNLADRAMQDLTGDPNWTRPPGTVWHHKEDGVTMELIPSAINSRYGHTGGSALYGTQHGEAF